MRERYRDVLAMVRDMGNPSLFITMTANPKWTEITSQLKAGETAADRPDIVTRVFKLKLDLMLSKLTTEGILGETVAHVSVIELQKRHIFSRSNLHLCSLFVLSFFLFLSLPLYLSFSLPHRSNIHTVLLF